MISQIRNSTSSSAILALAVFAFFFGSPISHLQAAPEKLQEKQIALSSLQEEYDSVKVQIEYLGIKVRDSKTHLRRLEEKMAKQRERVKSLQSQIDGIASESADVSQSTETLGQEIEKSREKYEETLNRFRARLVHLHKIKQGTLLDSIFSAKDLNSFLNRFQMVRYLLLSDRTLLEDLQNARQELQKNIEAQKQKQARLAELTTEIQKNREELLLETSSLSAMLQSLILEKKLFLVRQKRLQQDLANLEGEMAKVETVRKSDPETFEKNLLISDVPKAVQKRPTPSPIPDGPQATLASASTPHGFKVPIQFGWPMRKFKDPGFKADSGPQATLKLISAGENDAIAVAPGKVMFSGRMANFRNMIIISHSNGYSSVYGYLNDSWVGLGQTVEAGETIGHLKDPSGDTLYFEIRLGGVAQNLLSLLPKLH